MLEDKKRPVILFRVRFYLAKNKAKTDGFYLHHDLHNLRQSTKKDSAFYLKASGE